MRHWVLMLLLLTTSQAELPAQVFETENPPTIAVPIELQPSPAPVPTNTAVPTPPLRDSMVQLDADMAEASYKLNPSKGNRDVLANAYERLIEALCMPEIHRTLRYEGNPAAPACLDYLGRLKEVQPDNAVVLCAQDGIDSPDCRSHFEEQEVNTFSSVKLDKGAAAATELQASLSDSKAQPELERIRQQISEARSTEENDEQRETVLRLWNAAITAACKISSLALIPVSRAAHEAQKKGKAAETKDDLELAIEALGGAGKAQERADRYVPDTSDIIDRRSAKPTAPPKQGDYLQRRRLLSGACFSTLNDALEFDKKNPVAICYFHGMYSPACIDALRQQRTKRTAKGGTPSAPTSNGLSAF